MKLLTEWYLACLWMSKSRGRAKNAPRMLRGGRLSAWAQPHVWFWITISRSAHEALLRLPHLLLLSFADENQSDIIGEQFFQLRFILNVLKYVKLLCFSMEISIKLFLSWTKYWQLIFKSSLKVFYKYDCGRRSRPARLWVRKSVAVRWHKQTITPSSLSPDCPSPWSLHYFPTCQAFPLPVAFITDAELKVIAN